MIFEFCVARWGFGTTPARPTAETALHTPSGGCWVVIGPFISSLITIPGNGPLYDRPMSPPAGHKSCLNGAFTGLRGFALPCMHPPRRRVYGFGAGSMACCSGLLGIARGFYLRRSIATIVPACARSLPLELVRSPPLCPRLSLPLLSEVGSRRAGLTPKRGSTLFLLIRFSDQLRRPVQHCLISLVLHPVLELRQSAPPCSMKARRPEVHM